MKGLIMPYDEALTYITVYTGLGLLIAIAAGGLLFPSYRKERR
jgi:hypothetical protein